MNYKKQVSNNTSSEAYLNKKVKEDEKQELKNELQKLLTEQLQPVKSENEILKEEKEKLRQRVEELEAALKTKEEKYGSVRMQFQILYFLFGFDFMRKARSTKEKTAILLSCLLNRHIQSPREQLSGINEIIYSPNKGIAKNIQDDLAKTKEIFELSGFKEELNRVEDAIKNPQKFSQIL